MTSTENKPFDWIRQVPTSVLELDDIPLFGQTPVFPITKLIDLLSAKFNLQDLAIEIVDRQWRSQDQLADGLGDRFNTLNITISGYSSPISWLFGKDDVSSLCKHLFSNDPQQLLSLDPDYEEGFYTFLAIQTLDLIQQTDFDKTLSFQVMDDSALPSEGCFCFDLRLTLGHLSYYGRLLLPKSFQQEWKKKKTDTSMNLLENNPSLAQTLMSTVHLEIGRTMIDQNEWKNVEPGDFILLDKYSLKDNNTGQIDLTINNLPFYTGQLKDGSIKIVEHTQYHEVSSTMDDKELPDEEGFDEEEEFEEFEDFDDDFDEEDDDEDDDEDLEEFDEDEESQEESLADFEEEPPAGVEVPESISEEAVKEAQHITSQLEKEREPVASLNEIPMSIVVELGRVRMTVEQLMNLQPGNMLDLNIAPEQGVDLTVNGRRIAKGELLQAGDLLGVRILEVG